MGSESAHTIPTFQVSPNEVSRVFTIPLAWLGVVASALLTVALFLILQEQRAGQAGRRLVHTFTRAEASLAEALGGWTPGSLNRALPGVRDSLGTMGSDVAIRRLNQGLFLLTVRVRDGATEARLGRLVRVRPLRLAATAALTAGGQVRLEDAATISGEDRPPAGSEDCPPADSAVAGVAAPLGAPDCILGHHGIAPVDRAPTSRLRSRA